MEPRTFQPHPGEARNLTAGCGRGKGAEYGCSWEPVREQLLTLSRGSQRYSHSWVRSEQLEPGPRGSGCANSPVGSPPSGRAWGTHHDSSGHTAGSATCLHPPPPPPPPCLVVSCSLSFPTQSFPQNPYLRSSTADHGHPTARAWPSVLYMN